MNVNTFTPSLLYRLQWCLQEWLHVNIRWTRCVMLTGKYLLSTGTWSRTSPKGPETDKKQHEWKKEWNDAQWCSCLQQSEGTQQFQSKQRSQGSRSYHQLFRGGPLPAAQIQNDPCRCHVCDLWPLVVGDCCGRESVRCHRSCGRAGGEGVYTASGTVFGPALLRWFLIT